jgi:hypothetical protein
MGNAKCVTWEKNLRQAGESEPRALPDCAICPCPHTFYAGTSNLIPGNSFYTVEPQEEKRKVWNQNHRETMAGLEQALSAWDEKNGPNTSM